MTSNCGGDSASEVDPAIWRATAGGFLSIPTLGARVFYFPQGHFEQCLSSAVSAVKVSAPAVDFHAPPPAFFLCRVVSVRFLAHPTTDQPFACVKLLPIFGSSSSSSANGACGRTNFADVSKNGGYDRGDFVDADVSNCGYCRSDFVGNVSSNNGGYNNRKNVGVPDVSNCGYGRSDLAAADVSKSGTCNGKKDAVAEVRKNGGYNRKNVVDDVSKCCFNRSHSVVDDAGNGGYNLSDFAADVSRSGEYKRKDGAADVSSGGGYESEDDVVSFTKILTPSDANNGGGFSVPRFCADSIFPPLDFEADPPVQNLVIRDVHGTSFGFRHIYRGTPRRHLLTTGWSKFVNSKKLVAGDSVVFMRKRRTGALYLGVRRALRGDDVDVSETWNSVLKSVGVEKGKEDETVAKAVVVDAVLEALEKAVRGKAFEVVFSPRPGWSEFIVKEESVRKAISMVWLDGMRVKMPMETEDSTRTSWFHGTVSSASRPDHGPWRGSPWRMLQVAWDESEILQHVNRVNPWQVERVLSPALHFALPPTKKFRGWEDIRILPSIGEMAISMPSFSNSSMGPLTTSYSDYTFFPAGMQGARQIQDSGSFLYRFLRDGTDKMDSEELTDNDMQLKLGTLSTELNIGSLPSDTSSVDNSSCFNGTGQEGKQDSSSSTKVGQRPIQLFGKIIGMEKPAEDSSGNEECSS